MVESLVVAWGCMGAACCSAVGPDNRTNSKTPSPHWRTHDASHQGCNGLERPDSAAPTQGKCGTVRTLWFLQYLLASGTLQNCILHRIAKIARAARASGGALLILKEYFFFGSPLIISYHAYGMWCMVYGVDQRRAAKPLYLHNSGDGSWGQG